MHSGLKVSSEADTRLEPANGFLSRDYQDVWSLWTRICGNYLSFLSILETYYNDVHDNCISLSVVIPKTKPALREWASFTCFNLGFRTVPLLQLCHVSKCVRKMH